MSTIPEIAQEIKKLNEQIEKINQFQANMKRRI